MRGSVVVNLLMDISSATECAVGDRSLGVFGLDSTTVGDKERGEITIWSALITNIRAK